MTSTRPGAGRVAHALSLLTAGCIFPLIFVGAGVTTKDVGMVFPDWPTSDGALVNPEGWLQHEGKRWEHGHRLIGWIVGMLAIASVAASWKTGGAVRALSCVTLGMIIVQGLMGGLRVTENSRALAMVHGVWGQLTFCTASIAAFVTSRSFAIPTPFQVAGARFYQVGSVIGCAAVFIQLCLGAWYRHFSANTGLICHVLWAIVVFLILSWLTMWTLEQYPRLQPLSFLGKSMAVLIALQMILGGAAFLVRVMGVGGMGFLETMAPTAHVAVGALMLACAALIALSAFLKLSPAPAATQPRRTETSTVPT